MDEASVTGRGGISQASSPQRVKGHIVKSYRVVNVFIRYRRSFDVGAGPEGYLL